MHSFEITSNQPLVYQSPPFDVPSRIAAFLETGKRIPADRKPGKNYPPERRGFRPAGRMSGFLWTARIWAGRAMLLTEEGKFVNKIYINNREKEKTFTSFSKSLRSLGKLDGSTDDSWDMEGTKSGRLRVFVGWCDSADCVSLATSRNLRFFISWFVELDVPPKYGDVRSRLWMFTKLLPVRGGDVLLKSIV